MSNKSISLGLLAAIVAVAGMAGQASASPNCHTGGGYGASKVAAKPAPAPRQVLASKPPSKPEPRLASAAPVAQGGGEDGASVAPAPKKVSASAVVPAPVAVLDKKADQGNAGSNDEVTSVSGIAARLAALSAQQLAKPRGNIE